MRIQIQLITLMRIRILFYADADLGYQTDADTDLDPQLSFMEVIRRNISFFYQDRFSTLQFLL